MSRLFLPQITKGVLILAVFMTTQVAAQSNRTLSGVVATPQFDLVPGVSIEVRSDTQTISATSDREGRFSVMVPNGALTVTFTGKNLRPTVLDIGPSENLTDLLVKISYSIAPFSESVTITADALVPTIEFRNGSIYENTLFSRDDQLIQTLNAGINAGQHEGGGKSLEIRRYGFNSDHGGVNGGLRIVVDGVQQNQGTQGHGQGYLGALKSLSPELVEDVSIINGPFSAVHGDFSGLGVVEIRQKESLPTTFTGRVQGGSFNTFRGFFAVSPKRKNIDSFLSYEPSYTDGPFINPLKYRRDNISGNLTYRFDEKQALGFRLNFGRNNFTSSGQIPLDLVARGELDRFGFIDPENGGRVRAGTAALYFRREFSSVATLRADAFLGRSLFDLFSNFTFFAADPVYGDEIQQHDSRLQEGASIQLLFPYEIFGGGWLFTTGTSFHANQIKVGLYPSIARSPNRKFLPGNIDNPAVLYTLARAKVNNFAAYAQNAFSFYDGHVRAEIGIRFDHFSFSTDGFELSDIRRDVIGKEGELKVQPKLSVAFSPFDRVPLSFYANYGRGISSQDARGVIRDPMSPKVSTTDFYQSGASYNGDRFSGVFSGFFIDRSNEQVYIPDDGSIELSGASRSYGFEGRSSIRLSKNLSFNGGFTRVLRAFYPGEFTAAGQRVIVDSSPRFVSNAGLVLANARGFNASLTWRHVSNYRLDPDDDSIRAGGNDVVDLSISKKLRSWVDLTISIDNLLNKRYFETQNFFESRTCLTCPIESRIHATPGYPLTIAAGLTFRIGKKK